MTMDFRSRSADVRREAADILWRFRSSRAARRNSPAAEPAEPAGARVSRPALPVSPATEELIRAARQAPSSGGGAPDPVMPEAVERPDAGVSVTRGVPGDDPTETGPSAGAPPRQAVVDSVAAEAAIGTPVDVVTAPVADSPAGDPEDAEAAAPGAHATPDDEPPGAAPDAPQPDLPDEGVTARVLPDAHSAIRPGPDGGAAVARPVARELSDLPGVGAGLVWLLGRCGVHTLDDLARADAARLEQDLGLVGQLLDLPSWIDLARQAIPAERNATP